LRLKSLLAAKDAEEKLEYAEKISLAGAGAVGCGADVHVRLDPDLHLIPF
jgi:hypothetical protein